MGGCCLLLHATRTRTMTIIASSILHSTIRALLRAGGQSVVFQLARNHSKVLINRDGSAALCERRGFARITIKNLFDWKIDF